MKVDIKTKAEIDRMLADFFSYLDKKVGADSKRGIETWIESAL